MFSNKAQLQVGSEYHESLVSFIRQESESGMISLKKYHRFILLKWALILLCLAITFAFFTSIYLFIRDGSLSGIAGTAGYGFMLVLLMTVLSILSFGLQNKLECIEDRFNDDSLMRLFNHGAPDDVIDSIILALGRTGDLSYVEVYDIYWVCSRTSNGIDKAHLLGERYKQIKKRVRNRNFIKGHV
ncbi:MULTISPECIES: hypothetical protein [Enterobacteriaceae]|uniref:hypothetical protein n=1 Tax=Enterobacteriaceae TaxID=543 RepID=UPI000BFD8B70|nr:MULTISPECIES: hypothetical protein [Enterobacteriaceae]EKV3343553.1 hypothetical protein [Klebsiella pneumoniae]HAU4450909.1 hypothetical protein [Citrobacter freundii]EKZ6090822.1 hypothetical protein [Klebsiella pneumoniae]MBG2605403.1 hypothetical protein [Klebsiella oxytoca]PHH11726.1 hypothetical protein CRX54_28745 [Klebsiella oxytoca]